MILLALIAELTVVVCLQKRGYHSTVVNGFYIAVCVMLWYRSLY